MCDAWKKKNPKRDPLKRRGVLERPRWKKMGCAAGITETERRRKLKFKCRVVVLEEVTCWSEETKWDELDNIKVQKNKTKHHNASLNCSPLQGMT